jgi:hypothetical protein
LSASKKGAYFSDEAACVDNRFPDARLDRFRGLAFEKTERPGIAEGE